MRSVVVFQRPDPNFKLKLAFFSLAVLVLELPIILSWIFYSKKAVEYNDAYYLPILFGILCVGLTYFSISVVI